MERCITLDIVSHNRVLAKVISARMAWEYIVKSILPSGSCQTVSDYIIGWKIWTILMAGTERSTVLCVFYINGRTVSYQTREATRCPFFNQKDRTVPMGGKLLPQIRGYWGGDSWGLSPLWLDSAPAEGFQLIDWDSAPCQQRRNRFDAPEYRA
jgi:hypothetical protein